MSKLPELRDIEHVMKTGFAPAWVLHIFLASQWPCIAAPRKDAAEEAHAKSIFK